MPTMADKAGRRFIAVSTLLAVDPPERQAEENYHAVVDLEGWHPRMEFGRGADARKLAESVADFLEQQHKSGRLR